MLGVQLPSPPHPSCIGKREHLLRIKDIKAPERLGLLDLRRKAQVVSFSDGREAEVVGLSTGNVGDLMERFVPMQKYFMGAPVTVAEILATTPEAIPLIIAMGFKQADNPEAVEAAADLTIEEQSELLEAIGKATFTRGFGPFDLRLRALGLAVKGEETGRVPATTSPRPQRTSSPPASPKSGSSDSPPDTSPPTPSSQSEDASADLLTA